MEYPFLTIKDGTVNFVSEDSTALAEFVFNGEDFIEDCAFHSNENGSFIVVLCDQAHNGILGEVQKNRKPPSCYIFGEIIFGPVIIAATDGNTGNPFRGLSPEEIEIVKTELFLLQPIEFSSIYKGVKYDFSSQKQ